MVPLLQGCLFVKSKKASFNIDNTTTPLTKEVSVELTQGEFVHKVKIMVTGELNDSVKLDGVTIGPGIIDEIIREGNYYASNYSLAFEPLKNNGGDLEVELIFYY